MANNNKKCKEAIDFIANNYNSGNHEALKEAVETLIQYASPSDGNAQKWIGYCYYHGFGVKLSNSEAAKWFKKSLQNNHIPAYYWLGTCYRKGHGVPKDKEKAKSLFKQGMELGNAYSEEAYYSMEKNAKRVDGAKTFGAKALMFIGNLGGAICESGVLDDDDLYD